MTPQGYPDEKELKSIREWAHTDFPALMEFLIELWKYDGITVRGRTYRCATAGWSGNEELIEALEKNFMFMSLCWQSSHRGGLHIFRLPKVKS